MVIEEEYYEWKVYALFSILCRIRKGIFLTESFVTIEKDNFKTYSIKYKMLYKSIYSEIDCLLKEICNLINPLIKVKSLPDYYNVVIEKYKKRNSYF